MMKVLRIIMVVAILALSGCGQKGGEQRKVETEGLRITASTDKIVANNKKGVKFTVTYNGVLITERNPRLTAWVDSTATKLPGMKFSTSQVGTHNIHFTYTTPDKENPQTLTSENYVIRSVAPASTGGLAALALFYILAPAGVIWACNRSKLLGKIGPVLILYFIGIIMANINIIPEGCMGLQDTISTIAIPLALPMMLYSCNFKNFSIKTSLKITIIGVVAVALASLVGFLTLRDGLGEEAAVIGSSIAGKCTGGTPNLAALKVMLHMENSTFIIINSFDMIICFIYLVFLMAAGIKLARKWLGRGIYTKDTVVNLEEYAEAKNPYKDFGKKTSIKQLVKVVMLTLVIVGASFAVATFAKSYNEHIFTVVMILTITTLALIFSLWQEVKSWDKSYDAGMYLIYIFCLAMAMLADLSQLDWKLGLWVLIYQVIIIFGSLAMAVVLARPFKVDADSAVITSDTLVNSPICVPMIAATMKNKGALMVGITNGLAGYAVGNYLGYIMYQLLQHI
jgi:uncharacterized membrane protein